MKTPTRHTFCSAAYLVFERGGKVLVGRRQGTVYRQGDYSVPAGHLDGGESASTAAIREALEEVGIVLKPGQLQMVHAMHRFDEPEYFDFYFRVTDFEGEPQIMEPHKCDDLRWVAYDELPENMVPEVRIALRHIQDNIPYSEYNFSSSDL